MRRPRLPRPVRGEPIHDDRRLRGQACTSHPRLLLSEPVGKTSDPRTEPVGPASMLLSARSSSRPRRSPWIRSSPRRQNRMRPESGVEPLGLKGWGTWQGLGLLAAVLLLPFGWLLPIARFAQLACDDAPPADLRSRRSGLTGRCAPRYPGRGGSLTRVQSSTPGTTGGDDGLRGQGAPVARREPHVLDRPALLRRLHLAHLGAGGAALLPLGPAHASWPPAWPCADPPSVACPPGTSLDVPSGPPSGIVHVRRSPRAPDR